MHRSDVRRRTAQATALLVLAGLLLPSVAPAQIPGGAQIPGDTIVQPPEGVQTLPDSVPVLAPDGGNAGQVITDPSLLESLSLSSGAALRRLGDGRYLAEPGVLDSLVTAAPDERPSENGETGSTTEDSIRYVTSPVRGGLQRRVLQAAAPTEAPASVPADGMPARRSAGGPSYLLPVRTVELSGGGVTGYYRPYIEAPGSGLSLVGTEEGFEGTLYLGVWDSLHPKGRRELPRPIEFQVASDGSATVTPSLVTVRHTQAPLQEVSITSRALRDSVHLTIWTPLAGRGIEVPLPIRRPGISVSASPSGTIPGLGLGTTTLDVTLDRLGSQSVEVALAAQRGALSRSSHTISATDPASTRLRSNGLGRDTITVTAAGFQPDRTVIRYGFPYAFLIATLLGGLAGATLHYLRENSDDGASPSYLRELGGGLLTAVIVGAASTVGVNFLPFTFSAETGAAFFFTVAALAAYLWETVDLSGFGR